jgi:hypothetical protein
MGKRIRGILGRTLLLVAAVTTAVTVAYRPPAAEAGLGCFCLCSCGVLPTCVGACGGTACFVTCGCKPNRSVTFCYCW